MLLQNGHVPGTSTPLLPADPAKLAKVVIVGNLAGTVTLGGYSGDPALQVSAVRGITAAVKAASPRASVVFDSCHTSTTTTAPADCPAATKAAIKSAGLDLSHATVSYYSSDPAVATVSQAGVLHATGAGVATISVTVDGVTGSAPIVVR